METTLVSSLLKALVTLTLTPHIRQYLEATDPKALEQARKALKGTPYEDQISRLSPAETQDFRKVSSVGLACASNMAAQKIALANVLLIAGQLATEIGLYEGGMPFEKKCWSIVGAFQRTVVPQENFD